MRGKQWSIDEERQLRTLVGEGKSFDEISRIMGKTRLSIKGKLFNSGLNSVVVATGVQNSVATTIATTTTRPAPESVTQIASRPVRVSCVSADVVGADLKLPDELPSVEEEKF